MKKYEKMSKDEIVSCLGFYAITGKAVKDIYNEFMKEIEEVPRWKTIQSEDDLRRIFSEFHKKCDGRLCRDCEFNPSNSTAGCLEKYLMQKVEIEK